MKKKAETETESKPILHAGFPPPDPAELPDVLKPKVPREEDLEKPSSE